MKDVSILQVGFDAGDGTNAFNHRLSRTPNVVTIERSSNAGMNGRYIFRTDLHMIVAAQVGRTGMYDIIFHKCLEYEKKFHNICLFKKNTTMSFGKASI